LAVAAIALTLAIAAPGLLAPAGARAANMHASHRVAGGYLHGLSAKKPKKAKASAGHPWAKKDIAEIALLALLPFAVMGLLMFVSGYRRLHVASASSTRTSAPPDADQGQSSRPPSQALRVPQVTAYFWIVKGLSTAMGESTSDYLVHRLDPVTAVLLGFAGFAVALVVQFSMRRYFAWTYWFAVVMVGVFGTMAADVLHVGLGVPYIASAALYAVVLAGVFWTWQRSEKSLSIHSIDTPRRELFYWAAVVSTFALGTAVGDVTALTFHFGYFGSIVLFAVVIVVPVLGFLQFNWNPILTFWFAYVVTRPLGASVADWMGKPRTSSGLGWGAGHVSLAITIIIAALVAYLAVTRRDVQDHPNSKTAAVGRAEL
jgi:uncharacterized membrane-anchored protein